MTRPDDPFLPEYGRSTLGELLPSVAANLTGVGEDVLGLPSAQRYVVLMVDGLGWALLHSALPQLGYFPELLGDAKRLTSGVPSTTATSLTSLGTGLVPGRHGIVGYCFREGGALLNPLSWDEGPDPRLVQPNETVFEALARAGVAVTSVAPVRFEGSGLTIAGLRGPAFSGVEDEDDLADKVRRTVAAAQAGERSLVYLYERSLDHIGHGMGVASPNWLAAFVRIDAFVEQLRGELPSDVVLLITGDHGMVDVAKADHIMFEDHPELVRDVDLFAGEGRLRQLYTRRPKAVAETWAGELGERAWVRTREEAIAEGWFGEVAASVEPRIGDVLVAMRDQHAVMSRELSGELTLVGMHGSLTEAEMCVPLLIDEGW